MNTQASFFRRSLRQIAILPAVLLCIGLFSCEQVIQPNVQPEYVPKILLYGSIIAGDTISSLYVARTLPLFDSVLAERSAVTTATIRLRVDGREYPMQLEPMIFLNSNGTTFRNRRSYYRTVPPVIAEEGKEYEIIAEWQGLRAQVKTFVPRAVPIESAREIIVDSKDSKTGADVRHYRYEATFTPQRGVVYSTNIVTDAGADTTTENWRLYSDFWNPASNGTKAEADSLGKLRLTFLSSPALFIPGRGWQTPNNPHIVLHQIDEALLEYARTFGNSFASSNPFTIGGVNAKWNVTGDGIGIVVGMSSSRLRVR